ncbi:MAG: carboxypeptidase-like regulatory domain-containing protein [Acidobacteriota bacterium]|nr:carboxypeptidase-like regulatory domain-containing protein [Acidobacteriota bacterium]
MATTLKSARTVCALSLVFLISFFGKSAEALQLANVPQSPIPGGGYSIAGTVVSKSDGRPLARARIMVQAVKKPEEILSAITSEDGKFNFSGLPVGKYSLGGAKRGFISGAYDQHDQFSTAIVLGAGLDTESLVLRLAPAAIISGVVFDEVGEPVRQATVTAYHDDHSSGVSVIHEFGSAQTNDLGEYEITPLLPGTYFLAARAKPWYAIHVNSPPAGQTPPPAPIDRSFDVAYPTTYYPNVTDADGATPIPVRGGDHLQADIHVSPVPAVSVIFRDPNLAAGGFVVPQLQQPVFDDTISAESSGNFPSPGVFEISGIPAGRYNIRIGEHGGEQALQMNGIDLNSSQQEIDTSAGEASSKVKISVQIAGEPALPSRLAVGLRPKRRVNTAWQLVNAKGEALVEQIAPGVYEVLIASSGKPYAISHISADGSELSGHNLDVKAGSSPAITITLVGGSTTVEGIAKRAEKAVAGAMIVLVPKDPETNRALFRRDQSDLDGTFSLKGVIPGVYNVVAIENGWDLDWSQPGVIAAYLKHGRPIDVGSQGVHTMTLAEPIVVQSK